MYSLTLKENTVDYATSKYGRGNLSSVLETNAERLFDYIDKGNWVLQNQNPLVQFLVNLSLDINQSDEYLYNEIASRMNRLASECKFTSLYNKGKSFTHAVFPEKEHETLIVVPFGDNAFHSQNYYFSVSVNNLRPLRTLYTTDTRIRYSTNRMTDQVPVSKSDYTIVQLDPFALAIGYVRYCRERIASERLLGLTPQSYIANIPLATFYVQHNQYVFMNLMGEHKFKIDDTKWTKVDISTELDKYLIWLKQTLEGMVFKSFNHFERQLKGPMYAGDELNQIIFPVTGLSLSFKQMSWVYSFGGMDWASRYLRMLQYQGRDDSAFREYLHGFFKYTYTTVSGSIPSPLWSAHFKGLYNDLQKLAIK